MENQKLLRKIMGGAGTGALMVISFVVGGMFMRTLSGNPAKTLASLLGLISVLTGMISSDLASDRASNPAPAPQQVVQQADEPTPTPTETLPPNTPLARPTATRTLLPPPTFEPPTLTPAPSNTPTLTPTSEVNLEVVVPGLNGLETPTPSSTPGCEPRKEWTLIYEVQFNDALANIAQKYGTYVEELVAANCLRDPNVIVVGQRLRVPGSAHPNVPAVECTRWEVMTPFDGAHAINGAGEITFNWRGPRAPRNLIRVYRPDGTTWERTIDLRQNESVSLANFFPAEGTYQWQVFPLDMNFQQVACQESPRWTFHKTLSPTLTPTPDPNSTNGGGNTTLPPMTIGN